MNPSSPKPWYASWRILMPSAIGLCLSFGASLMFIGLYMIFLSLETGMLAPQLFGEHRDQWVKLYDSIIVGPLSHLLHHAMFSTIMTSLLWCAASVIVIICLVVIVRAMREMYEARHNISLTSEWNVIPHPLFRRVALQWAWRFGVCIAMIVATLLALTLFRRLLGDNASLMMSGTTSGFMLSALVLAIKWTIIAHCYIIALRLLYIRQRLLP